MRKPVIVVGGIPNPIGGVTTFIRRLLRREPQHIGMLVDLYPGKKEIPKDIEYIKRVSLNSKIQLVIWLLFNLKLQKKNSLFFNFSSAKSLFLLMIIPKLDGCYWQLMLHHGELEFNSRIQKFVYNKTLSKFDVIYSLSPKQNGFYESVGAAISKIKATTSYCAATSANDLNAIQTITDIRKKYKKVIVMSGYPTSIYNFEFAIQEILPKLSEDYILVLFIYGDGDLRMKLDRYDKSISNFKLFDSVNEDYFNSFLSRSDIYLRTNSLDSFGISVADAVEYGLNVIASNVCKRYPGAQLVDWDDVNSILNLIDNPFDSSKEIDSNTKDISFNFECPQLK